MILEKMEHQVCPDLQGKLDPQEREVLLDLLVLGDSKECRALLEKMVNLGEMVQLACRVRLV